MGQASGSKLVRRLLKTPNVTSVFLGRDFVSVNKKEDASWAVSRARARAACRACVRVPLLRALLAAANPAPSLSPSLPSCCGRSC